MDIGAIIIIIIVSIVLVITFYIIGIYNSLLDAQNRVKDQFKQIALELNKIGEIVPSIIEILKNNTKYEKKLINELEKETNKLSKTNDINKKMTIAINLNNILTKTFKLKDTYPELKSNRSFILLQKKIKDTKERIKYASTFYNDTVIKYNNLKKGFTARIVTKIFKFKEINLLEIE